jgi:hypothetical protein
MTNNNTNKGGYIMTLHNKEEATSLDLATQEKHTCEGRLEVLDHMIGKQLNLEEAIKWRQEVIGSINAYNKVINQLTK